MSDTAPSAARLVDSPWLWLALFAAMALLAIVVMGPKYARREADLEQKAAARQAAATRQRETGTPERADDAPSRSPPPSGKLQVGLVTLGSVVAAVLLVSLAGLARQARARL